jgi:hypothetical protein
MGVLASEGATREKARKSEKRREKLGDWGKDTLFLEKRQELRWEEIKQPAKGSIIDFGCLVT